MKRKLIFPVAAIAALGTLVSVGQYTANTKLRMAEAAIAQLYVDTVNEDKVVEDAIRGMLNELDPHSSYSTAEETRALNEPLSGKFSGVGIMYNMNNDTLYVLSTVAGGPAEKVGMRAGDRIISVNDSVIAGVKISTRDIQHKLRGPKGTHVNVTVLRREAGSSDTVQFKITRDDIPINSVDAAYMVDSKTGFIRLNKFAEDTPKEMREAISKLQKQGMQQLILDLVDNGGGYLNAAPDMLGEFLAPGSMVVYTEGRNSPRYELKAYPKGKKPLFAEGRLVVMVNQYSASAAEIASGAIQDWDRGVIVGRRTFGKGLVQRPIPFPDGSMMRLTVAHYYTPTGRYIQKPYDKGKGSKYAQDILDRLNSGELMHADSVKQVDSLRVSTLRLHRPVYGGGGISPDRFVALDTMAYTKYYRNVVAKGVLNKYVINYVDKHRKDIKKKYRNDDDFVRTFEVSDGMIADLRAMAEQEKVEYNAEQEAQSLELFKMIIKALIGRDTFTQETYFKVYNAYDPIFREALRVINSDDYDDILPPSAR